MIKVVDDPTVIELVSEEPYGGLAGDDMAEVVWGDLIREHLNSIDLTEEFTIVLPNTTFMFSTHFTGGLLNILLAYPELLKRWHDGTIREVVKIKAQTPEVEERFWELM